MSSSSDSYSRKETGNFLEIISLSVCYPTFTVFEDTEKNSISQTLNEKHSPEQAAYRKAYYTNLFLFHRNELYQCTVSVKSKYAQIPPREEYN